MEAVKQTHLAREYFSNSDCDIDLATFLKIENLLSQYTYTELIEQGMDELEYVELKRAFEHYKVIFLS
ncbi:MAG: hypothetical protein SCALA702_15370 [Melioribacteraceae bacterium]|nr:MAG: hypothetical protein SCALA702_15370 [Melioribacteraceae bacterium]